MLTVTGRQHMLTMRGVEVMRTTASACSVVCLGELFDDAGPGPFWRCGPKVDGPQLGHEAGPQRRAARCKYFGAHPQPLRRRAVSQTPLAKLREDRHELDGRLCQAVGRPSPRPCILSCQE